MTLLFVFIWATLGFASFVAHYYYTKNNEWIDRMFTEKSFHWALMAHVILGPIMCLLIYVEIKLEEKKNHD